MKLRFTKMHGAGNDFIVIDGINQRIEFSPAQWRFLADRRFGIGADQILLVEAASLPGVDFCYRIFNADGGEVEQCGNGARAFVKFVTEKGLCSKRSIQVQTRSGLIGLTLENDGRITVNMGAPVLEAARIPFDVSGLQGINSGSDTLWPIDVGGKSQHREVLVSLVSMGNPHAVQLVDDVEAAPVSEDGPLIERHLRFPHRVNAGFLQVIDRHRISLRVYERGAGETLACGTGACAAVVAGIRRNLLDSPVSVHMRGGELLITWAGETQPVMMTGPAVSVFEGEISL